MQRHNSGVNIIDDDPAKCVNTWRKPLDRVNGSVLHGQTSSELIEVRLTAIRYAARDVRLYDLQGIDDHPLPCFEPGAHIDLHLPNGISRSYSLGFAPSDQTFYTLGIKRDATGRGGSRYIHDELRIGAKLLVSSPRNNFRLQENAAHTELIAGGIGITPIWCMAQRLNMLGRKWRLHYASRSRNDMAFFNDLHGMPEASLHFDEESGRLLDVAAIVADVPMDAHLYCCGPAPMLQAFETATKDWPRGQVHVEHFTAKEVAPSRKGGFTIELARSHRKYYVPEGETILGVLIENHMAVDYSCESGICGACETRVIAGIPEHHDSILNDEEQKESKRVMICCAGCSSERLVLDL